MYRDYNSNNQYWDIFASEASQKWYKSIGHDLALVNIQWANIDIKEGFANFYLELAYYQNVITKPWINDKSFEIFTFFPDETYLHTEDGFNIVPIYSTRLNRQDYQNIYMPLEDIGNYYDLRINDLSQKLRSQNTSIYDEALKLNIFNRIQADKQWSKKEIHDFAIGDSYYLDDYMGNEVYGFEGFSNLTAEHAKQLYLTLADRYINSFEYREDISTKTRCFFSKQVNDDYQWLVLIPLISNTLYVATPTILLCKKLIKKSLKPKDVVFQHNFFAVGGNKIPLTYERALYSQYFYYINRSLERFIDWMEPRLLEVVDSF